MRFESIELNNIRSYKKESVRLPEGAVLLSGDVGHGKSSLLMAIEFALFGMRAGQLSGGDLLREGEKRGSVKVKFSVNGKEYEVKRTLSRKGDSVRQDSGYLVRGNMKKELTPTELKAEVFKILGYPMDMVSKRKSLIYRYTVYTPQEEMKGIIEASDERRLSTIRKVVGINKYKRIRGNVGTVGKELRGYQQKLEIIFGDLDEKVKEKKDLKRELQKLKKKLGGLEKEKEKREKKVGKWKKKKQEIKDKLKKYHRLDKKKSNLEQGLKNEKGNKSDHKEKRNDLKKKIQKIQKLEKPTSKSMSNLESKINSLEEKRDRYLESEKGISDEIDGLLEKKRKIEEKIKNQDYGIKKEKSKIETLNEGLDELKKAEANCPVCGHKLTEEHKKEEVRRKEDEIGNLESSIKKVEKSKKENEKKTEEIEKKIEKKVKKEIEGVKEKIKKLRKTKDELKEYKKKKKEERDLKEDLEEEEESIKKLKRGIKKARKQLKKVRKSLKELGDVEKKENKIEKNLEKAQENLTETKSEISSKKTEINGKSKKLEDLGDEIEKKRRAKNLEKRIRKHINWLENLGELSSTIERQYLIKLQKKFNSMFNDWFSILVEDGELDVRVNENFTPILEREGYKTEYRRLSGGERTSVALAYRLALNQVINSLVEGMNTKDLIILDEPTDGFSANQLDRIRDIINEIDMGQIILVSHEPEIESYVENTLRVYKEGGVSRIEA